MALIRRMHANRFIVRVQASFTHQLVLRKYLNGSTDLKEIMSQKIDEHRKIVQTFREKYGSKVVGEITVDQMYGGMRGMRCLLTETSEVDPEEGIRFRGRTIPECRQQLPKAPGGEEPLPEGLFWMLMTGEIPTYEQVKSISRRWAEQAELPQHVLTMLNNFPPSVHPMARFIAAITACNTESVFVKAYKENIPQSRYWEFIYEDAMSLIAKLPSIAATIYRTMYRKENGIVAADSAKDYAHNFTSMLGYDDPQFTEFIRLFLTLFSDHEGGNACAHTVRLVGSALSDPFLSFGAGMAAFGGPLHGLAIQEVLVWITKLKKKYGSDVTEAQMKDFIWETLKSGQVVPGYGHAVLRKTDPRFTTLYHFAMKHLPNDPLVKTVSTAYKVIPPILREFGKVANPWPNCDSISGAIIQAYGLKETQFYPVLFGNARALGVMAALIWSRALGLPMEEPTSIRSEELMRLATVQNKPVWVVGVQNSSRSEKCNAIHSQ